MVGFIGPLAGLGSALTVKDFRAVGLPDGSIVSGFFPGFDNDFQIGGLTGPKAVLQDLAIFAKNDLGPIGGFAAMRDPSLVALKDGFALVINRPVGGNPEDGRILFQRYSDDGDPLGAPKELAAGNFDSVKAFALPGGGVLVRYHDKSVPGVAGGEKVALFLDGRGNAEARVVIDPGAAAFSSSALVEVAGLANGNLAAVWTTDAGGLRTQVFRPDGTAVGGVAAIPGASDTDAIAALPGGGYVIAHRPSFGPEITVQRFTSAGVADGAAFAVPVGVDGAGGLLDAVNIGATLDIAARPDGLLVLTWQARDIAAGSNLAVSSTDIYMAVVTQRGEPVFGPAVVLNSSGSTQKEPFFLTLEDGALAIAFTTGTSNGPGSAVYLSEPDLVWSGTPGTDVRAGSTGKDVLAGLGGDDRIDGRAGGDHIRGGEGDDTLLGGDGGDDIGGEAGNDRLTGDGGNDTLLGGTGADRVDGGKGNDLVQGGDGADTLLGGGGSDTVTGGEGNDEADGGGGNDRILGDAGRDTLAGGSGNDSLLGGEDNDLLSGGAGNDAMEGGAGKDRLKGGTGDDALRGDDDDDVLDGGDGNDFLVSGRGNDRDSGGAGNDRIFEGEGNDVMKGGAGEDTFVFTTVNFGQDRIADFEFGVDTLDMQGLARLLTLNGLPAIRAVEVSAGVRLVVDSDTFVLVAGATLDDFRAGDLLITDPFG